MSEKQDRFHFFSHDCLSLEHHDADKTSAMAEAARDIGAVLVLATREEALRVKAEYGIKTAVVGRSLRGWHQPVLFDPDAVEEMSRRARKTEEWLHTLGESIDE